MARYAEERGRSFTSVGATGDFGQTPNATGLANGNGDEVVYVGRIPSNFRWEYSVAGGVFTSITVTFQISTDYGATWQDADSSTNVAGDKKNVVDAPATAARLVISNLVVASGTPRATGRILADWAGK